jgi:hypothetical protein
LCSVRRSDLTLEADDGIPLSGLVADQAALQGLFNKIRDLGLLLLSVNRVLEGFWKVGGVFCEAVGR